ncbi:nematocyst expressed protein 4-like [Haliotis rubra]|uniref:nematocyst expressed protein 4-like n=1 Tax=Haliotis rubra TaxID=36100 RepID=UPI001EE52AA2|nr:nematocyst expressed protein 4-like [Haliotis rubra]
MDAVLPVVALCLACIPGCLASVYCYSLDAFTVRYCPGVADYCCGGSCCTTFTTGIIVAIVLGAIFGLVVVAVTILAIVKTCCKTGTGRVIQPQPHSSVFVTSGQSGYPQYPMPTAGAAFVNPGPALAPNPAYPHPKGNPAYPAPNPPPYYPPPGGQAPPPAAPSYSYQSPGTAQLPGQVSPPVVAADPGQAPPPVVAADPGQAPPPASAPAPSTGNGS